MSNEHRSFIFGSTLRDQLKLFPDEERLKFLDAILRFGLDGNDTNFLDYRDAGIWTGMKPLLVALNKKHWSSQLNGRNGGRPADNLPEPIGTYQNLPEPVGYSNSSSNRNLGIGNSGYNRTTTKIDEKLYSKIIKAGIDPAWLQGQFTFIDFANEFIERGYPDKATPEQRRLVISAVTSPWANFVDNFPAWRERRQRESAVADEKQRIETAKKNSPTNCGHCSAPLGDEKVACPSCGYRFWYDDEKSDYIFQEPLNFDELNIKLRGGSYAKSIITATKTNI